MTKSWRSVYRGVSHPHPKGQGSSVPKKFGTSYVHTHSTRNSNQILYGDQTRCEENFYLLGYTLANIFGDTNTLARDIFAIANLLV